MPHSISRTCLIVVTLAFTLTSPARSQGMPHIEKRNGRFSMVVDGKPYLMLGAQINNSSSWPGALKDVWPALKDLHANTVEAPVYWEQMEAERGKFDFTNVDLLIHGARDNHLRLVLLWFGTWKNGQNHYVPEWVKRDPKQYPREQNARGKLLDVMSPHSEANLEADKQAFAALMRHVREVDSAEKTVILVQVENESGSVGSVRDFSPAAQKQFAGPVPEGLVRAMHVRPGTWLQSFGADADESFAAFATSRYINEVAKAGKAEYPLPVYCNVWITYPVHALENRDTPSAGQEYPSGGPQQQNIAIWKATAGAIDVLAPDFYSDDLSLFREVVASYARPDNALFIPETGMSKNFGRYLFYALGKGAIGFSPFGIDYTGWTLRKHELPESLTGNFALFEPMEEQIAAWNAEGKLQTGIEEKGAARQSLTFGDIEAVLSYGFPQRDGEAPPGTSDTHGRVLVAQLGPMEFLVTGVDTSVSFRFTPTDARARHEQLEILQAEEGAYEHGVWTPVRIWNGDQTDRGLNFRDGQVPQAVRIRLHTLHTLDQPGEPAR